MNGAVILIILFAFISWLFYLKSQHKKYFLQSKENYIKDIFGRYPTAEGLEKLVQSEDWAKLMDAYGKPPAFMSRFSVVIIAGLGILALCVSGASTILTIYIDTEMIYAAVMLGSIGIGLLINALVLNHYLKKWS